VSVRGRVAGLLHGLTDHVASGLFARARLFADGFGDLDRLDALVERVHGYAPRAAPAIELSWDEPERRDSRGAAIVRRGRFDSPARAILPVESATAFVEWWRPVVERARPRTCVLLAATGEEGFSLRRRLAAALVREGIGALLLENPFYGRRRPAGQLLALLRTVTEQFAMNTATVDEAHALLGWLGERGHRVGVTGYSQGGMMAAFAAALTTRPVAAIPRACGAAAAAIFTEDALSRRFDWDRLAQSFGDRELARRHFARCLEPIDACRFPPPRAPEAAILVASRHDRFIRLADVEALHHHWRGSELRWMPAGHLTGAVLHGGMQLRAMLDAFERCPDSG